MPKSQLLTACTPDHEEIWSFIISKCLTISFLFSGGGSRAGGRLGRGGDLVGRAGGLLGGEGGGGLILGRGGGRLGRAGLCSA